MEDLAQQLVHETDTALRANSTHYVMLGEGAQRLNHPAAREGERRREAHLPEDCFELCACHRLPLVIHTQQPHAKAVLFSWRLGHTPAAN